MTAWWPRAVSDLRARWSQSDELRKSTEAFLTNWAWYFRGGLPDLGYPHHANFVKSPSKCPPAVNVQDAEEAEEVFVLWRLMTDGDPDQDYLLHLQRLLRMHYLSPTSVTRKAKVAGVGRQKYYRLVREGLFRFWALHQLDS